MVHEGSEVTVECLTDSLSGQLNLQPSRNVAPSCCSGDRPPSTTRSARATSDQRPTVRSPYPNQREEPESPDQILKVRASDGHRRPRILLCDLGYGFPREGRPRREKILAIARQLVNVLEWQTDELIRQQNQKQSHHEASSLTPFQLLLVGCPDPHIQQALTDRMHELWKQSKHGSTLAFPSNLEFSDQSLDSFENAIYLSPDATDVLDVTQPAPDTVVVGLLIDRRIQVNRSMNRAADCQLATARWPLELVSDALDPCEPLNVDCILEGMQQWYWNCNVYNLDSPPLPVQAQQYQKCFEQAAVQALKHHQERHPQRPQHKV